MEGVPCPPVSCCASDSLSPTGRRLVGDATDFDMGYSQSKATQALSIFVSTCSCAPRVFRRASQGPQGRVVPFGGVRQGPIVGNVQQSAAPTGSSP